MNRVIVVSGVPRSGTSWLGQIFDSSPFVRYRYQPLFSHKFKNAISQTSTPEEFQAFFQNVYNSNDPFLCQDARRKEGFYPVFKEKVKNEPILVVKMVRFHNLLSLMLQYLPLLKLICIIRHPCGVINSWFKTPKEFPDDAEPKNEWEFGTCRNTSKTENVWGFKAWERISNLYLALEKKYNNRVMLVRYEDLVKNTITETLNIFHFCNLAFDPQAYEFLINSNKIHIEDPYSVYKSKSVMDKWQFELDEEISSKIIKSVKYSQLKRFIL